MEELVLIFVSRNPQTLQDIGRIYIQSMSIWLHDAIVVRIRDIDEIVEADNDTLGFVKLEIARPGVSPGDNEACGWSSFYINSIIFIYLDSVINCA